MNKKLQNHYKPNHIRFCAVFLFFWLGLTSASAFAQFAGGDGTEDQPYKITTLEQLDDVRNHTSSHFILINDIDASETATWNGGDGFTSIPGFSGSFDGKGHVIDGLKNSANGLFSQLGSTSVIKNLGVTNATIAVNQTSAAGILVGINFGTVEKCYSTGTIGTSRYVGGVIGRNESTGLIKNSYSFAEVTILGSISAASAAGGGGLTGYNAGTIRNSYSAGFVPISSNPFNIPPGGFIGHQVSTYTFENNFWDTQASGVPTSVRDIPRTTEDITEYAGITGKTTNEMTTAATFTDTNTEGLDQAWDFNTIWAIDPSVNDGYPYLRSPANVAPVVTNVSISGTMEAGEELTASYDYYDQESFDSDQSTFQWYRSDDAGGTNKTAIGGATNTTYTLTSSDGGKYISIQITPNDGEDSGTAFESNIADPVAVSNMPPSASNVSISGDLIVGKELTGSYDFSDDDDDSESGTTYQWYRSDDADSDNPSEIDGATSQTHTLTSKDVGKYILFEVTPNDGTSAGETVESDYSGPVASPFAGGEGTEVSPYQVATAEQLDYVRDFLDAYFIQTSDINLGVSPWNDGEGWEPIGTNSNFFTGTYDGNGHTISNLYIEREGTFFQGLFGYAEGAAFKNISVENAGVIGGNNTGGLVARNNNGAISNSYVSGSVSGGSYTGGLSGFSSSTITNSFMNGSVNGNLRTGGLVGQNTDGVITNSYASGSVSGSTNTGGLVGDNFNGTITNSFWDTETTGQGNSDGGTGKSTAQMKTKSTFTDAGWDFDDTWYITTELNNGYPVLRLFVGEVNSVPVASNVSISGDLIVGEELTGSYEFSDEDDDSESGSTFQWYRSDDSEGTGKAAIPEATNSSYTLTTSDIGKFISFQVIPSDGTGSGSAVESSLQGPVIGEASADQSTVAVSSASIPADGSSTTAVTVLLKDSNGNRLTTGGKSVFFETTGGTLSDVIDNEDGSYTVTLTSSTTAGLVTITAYLGTDNTGDEIGSSDITFAPGAVAGFVVEASGGGNISQQTAGQSFSIDITAQDANGNTVPDFDGTVDLSLNNGANFADGGGTTAAFKDGELNSHSVKINTANSDYIITATKSGDSESGSSNEFDVAVGDLSALVITTQPVGGASGKALGIQPIVELRDALGNILIGDSDTEVTVSIQSGDDGDLSGTLTQTAENGIVTFGNLTLSGLVNDDYVLQFTDGTLTVNSDDVNVTVGAPSDMAMNTQPSTTTAGVNISGPPSVLVTDGAGNPVSGVDVTVSLNQDDFDSGTATQVTDANGIAEFDNLVINTADSDYEITFTADAAGVNDVDSDSFDIMQAGVAVSNAETLIEIITNNVTANGITVAEVRATLVDEFDNPVPGVSVTFTSTGEAQLTNPSGMTDANGRYSVEITNTAAETIDITAVYGDSDDDIVNGSPAKVNFVPGSASQLAFIQQPNGGVAGNTFSPSVTIRLEDELGNLVNTDNVGITVAISDETTLEGTLTQNTTDGIATFGDLYVVEPASGYTLTASSGDLDTDQSNTFDITRRAITIMADAQTKTFGDNDPELTYQLSSGSLISGVNLTGSLERVTGEDAGSYAIQQGTLTNSNNPSYDIAYVSNDLEITAKDITLSNFAAADKVYDGTNEATGITFDDDRLNSDDLEFSFDADFEDANAASGKTVNITNITISGGADQDNYTLLTTSSTATADITPKELTVVNAQAQNKAYDGNTEATITNAELSGMISGDDVTLENAATGTFAQATVSTGIAVTTSMTLSGDDAGNYTLSQPAGLTADITSSSPVITAWPNASDIVYGQPLSSSFLTGGAANVSGSFSFTNPAQVPSAAGDYTAQATFTPDDTDNYEAVTSTVTVGVSPKIATITGITAEDKTYDGTTSSVLSGAVLNGIINGDDVSLTNETTGTFSQADAGEDLAVTTDIVLAGDDAENYTLTQPSSLTADIKIKELTIAGSFTVFNKVYDGTLPATINESNLSLPDVVSGDEVILNPVTVFADVNAGSAIEVVLTEATAISGSQASNYSLSLTGAPTSSADITAKPLTVTDAEAQNKIYDGNTEAVINGAVLDGVVADDDIQLSNHTSGTFAQAATGSGIGVTTTMTLAGEDAGNYTVTQPAGLSADITNATPVISAWPSAADITYGESLSNSTLSDGSSDVGGSFSFTNPETVPETVPGTVGDYTAEITFTPDDPDNYEQVSSTITVEVTQKPLTVTDITAQNKIYDGTTDAVLTGAVLQGVESGDDVTLTNKTSGVFTQSDVGEDIVVTTSITLTGDDSGNYSLSQPEGLKANITPKELSITGSFTAPDKVYDGDVEAELNSSNLSLSGVVNDEGVSLDQLELVFTDADAAEDIVVSINTAAITGAGAGNYSLSLEGAPTTQAHITPKGITITGSFTVANKIYDDTTTATIDQNNLSLNGVVGEDVVSLSPAAEFENKLVGSDKSVNLTEITSISGTDASNYTLSLENAPAATADITASQLTISGTFTAKNKVYDGSQEADIDANDLRIGGIKPGNSVMLEAISLEFYNSDAAEAISISITHAEIAGADASNYNLSLEGSPTSTADITAKELTISGSFIPGDKIYDDNTSAVIEENNLTLAGTVTGDEVELSPAAEFADKLVGSDKMVSLVEGSSVSGADAANYSLSLNGAPTATADILAGAVADETSTVTVNPETLTAGENARVTITLNDAFENPVTGLAEDDINMVLSGDAQKVEASFSESEPGVYEVAITDITAETITINIAADDVQLGEQPSVTFQPGSISADVSEVQVTSPHTANGTDASTLTIHLKDQYGNSISGITETDIALTYGDNATLANFTEAGNGAYTFTLTDTVAEEITVVVEADGTELEDNPIITFKAGEAAGFVISGNDTQVAGESQNLTITALDAFRNVAVDYTGDKTLTFSGASASPGTDIPTITDKAGVEVEFAQSVEIAFANGIATTATEANGQITLYDAGLSSIGVSDGNITENTKMDITVVPAAAHELVYIQQPSDADQRAVIVPTVQLQLIDVFGNNKPEQDIPVEITINGDATLSGSTSVHTNADGQAAFSDLSVAEWGTFKFNASAPDILQKESDEFEVFDITEPEIITGNYNTDNPSPVFKGSTGEPEGTTVEIHLNGKTYTGTVDENGDWSVAISDELASGDYTAEVVITDVAGNKAESEISLTINTSPDERILDDLLINNPNPALSGESDMPAGSVVSITIDGEVYTGTVEADGSWSVDVPADFEDGDYDLNTRITDADGNAKESSSVLTIDTVDPELVTGDLSTNDSTPVIAGVSDEPEGSTVSVSIGGELYEATVQADGTWSVEIPGELEDGTYNATVSITDGAGNTTESDITVGIDSSSSEEIVKNLVTNNPNPTLSGESDAPEGSDVSVTINGETYTGTVGEDGTWSIEVPADLEDGEYQVNARITEPNGSATESASELIIDTEDPELVAEDQVTGDVTPVITGSSDEPAGTVVTVTIDGQSYETTVDDEGAWSLEITDVMEAGDYTAVVSITDKAGNNSETEISITIDTTGPENLVEDLTTNNPSPTLTGESELPPGSTVYLTIDGKTYTGTVAGDGGWSIGVPEALKDGQYPVHVRVSDENGNTEESGSTLIIDTSAPVIMVAGQTTNDVTPVITGTSNEPAGSVVSVTINGETYIGTVGEDGTWSIEVTDELENGEYTATVAITDAAGNITDIEVSITISPTSSEPLMEDLLTNDASPVVNGVSDAPAGSKVSITIDGEIYTGTVDEDGTWSIEVSDELEDGEYEVNVRITDESGITSESEALLTIDTRAPELTAGSQTTGNSTPTITGSTNEPEGTKVTITINGKEYTGIVDEDGAWGIHIAEALEEGEYTGIVSITDVSGNTSEITIDVIVSPVSLQNITITATPDTIIADGTSISEITVQLFSIEENPITVSMGDVELFTDRGAIGEVTDHEDGRYTAVLTSSVELGSARITATFNGEEIQNSEEVVFISGAPDQLIIYSGNEQVQKVTTQLNDSLVVQVLDANGFPVCGEKVEFQVTAFPEEAEGQMLSDATNFTNCNGASSSALTLGTKAGEYQVEVRAAGIDTPIFFKLFAEAGAMVDFLMERGDQQEQPTLSVLSDSLVVSMKDEFGNPLVNEPVVFEIIEQPEFSRESDIRPDTAFSNLKGVASAAFRLGDVGGEYQVSATAFNQSDQTHIFTATATEKRTDPSVIDTVNTVVFNGNMDTYMHSNPSLSLNNLQSFTVELWILPQALTEYYELFKKEGEAAGNKQFKVWGDRNAIYVTFFLQDGSEITISANNIFERIAAEKSVRKTQKSFMADSVYRWTHLAFSVNNEQKQADLYRNGFRVGQANFEGNVNQGTADLQMGRGLDGEIHEVRIWDRALSRADIQSRMTQILSGNEENLVLYHTFDDNGEVAEDLTNNQNNLRLSSEVERRFSIRGIPDIEMLENEEYIMSFKDVDEFGDTLKTIIVRLPENGHIYQVEANGTERGERIIEVPATLTDTRNRALYIPDTNYFGVDSLGYRLEDVFGNKAESTRIITVHSVYRPPTVFSQLYPIANDSLIIPLRSPSRTVDFSWQKSRSYTQGETTYELSVWSTGGLEETYAGISDTTLSIDFEDSIFEYDRQYTWSVMATDGIDTTYTSEMSFIILREQPMTFKLQQNYPNPFNPSTKIEYWVPVPSKMRLEIFDILGRKVQVLADEVSVNPGTYNITWNADNLASGIYYYRLTAEGNNGQHFTKLMKMTLVK